MPYWHGLHGRKLLVHAKVTILEDQRLLAQALSLLFSLSLAPIPHSPSLPLSLISPLILREQRQWSLPAVPLLFKAFTVAILDILIKHDTTHAHTQAHRLGIGLSGVSCVAVWVLSRWYEMAELDEERECYCRELIVAITWAGVHNGCQ